jgi:hypothetical protein
MQSSIAIASIVFACVFGSALIGLLLHGRVPVDHLNAESKDVVKLAIGLIGTMAALVLGLLTASAKSSFDTIDSEIKQNAAQIVLLDRTLAQYGPETGEIRNTIRRALMYRLNLTWPEDAEHAVKVDAPETTPSVENIQAGIRALAPQNDAQRSLQSTATAVAGSLAGARWLILVQAGSALPVPFLIVLVLWLVVLFATFGLLAPRNLTVVIALGLCALSVSGSIFLILEMSQPLTGIIKVSSAPLHYALAHMGQ